MPRVHYPPVNLSRIPAVALLFLACSPRVESNDVLVNASRPLGDSIVLERTACYGSCPAYRLRLSNGGEIRFESRNQGDAGRSAVDTVPAGLLLRLVSRANTIGFFELPPKISGDSHLCPTFATDAPTVVVTVFGRKGTKRVEDYLGCRDRPESPLVVQVVRLRAFEAEIDSVLRSSRWVQAANRGP